MFVSRLVISFWLLCSLWQLGSWSVWWLYQLLYQLIYTNLFGIQNCLVYRVFILKVTNLFVYLPWPSRKQSTIFISSNSTSVFLTCSFLSAKIKTDPLICINLVLWKELNKYFLNFILKGLFFAMLGILSSPLFWWLKRTALCRLSKNCLPLTTILPLKRYLISVYTVHVLVVETKCIQFL